MRIVCPSCEAVYQVPDATLAKARVMRCARCAQVFEPPVVTPEPVPEEAMMPIEEAPIERAAPHEPEYEVEREPTPAALPVPMVPIFHDAATQEWPPPVSRARKIQVLTAWATSLVLLILLIGLGVVYRHPVMRAWPPSARLYAAIGLP